MDENHKTIFLYKESLNMIPKILHQIWFGEAPIPNIFLQRWRELHPDWEYKLWREDDLKHTDCWKFIQIAKKNSSKSNVARLYVILNYGGVYADLDVEFIQNIDSLLENQAFAAKEPHAPQWYGNAFFGAVAQHNWVRYQYDTLEKYAQQPPPWGPKLMTEASAVCNSLATIETKLIYPISCYEKAKNRNFAESYVVHHWNMSWKKEL